MNGIAIDIGSAYSTAARLNDEGVPTLIPDAQESDQLRTPSLIHLGTIGALVGHAAVVASDAQPELPIIEDAKSMLASGRVLGIDQDKKGWTAEECVAQVFTKLRQDASAHCFQAVDQVLLTVPSRFTSAQRYALRQSAQMAGLRVRAMVDECVAAAVYAASPYVGDRTLLVLQSGRCGLDVAVVRCSERGATVLASRHDGSLGGKAIDLRLADEIAAAQGWSRDTMAPLADKQLMRFAEQLKIALCQAKMSPYSATATSASSSAPAPASATQVQLHGLVGKSAVEFILTRWYFQQLVTPMFEQAWELIEKCLTDAGVDWPRIDRVVLAGGTMQLPALRTELIEQFALSPERIVSKNCSTAAAYGGAILAAQSDEQLARYESQRAGCNDREEREPLPAREGAIAMFEIGIRIGDPRSGQAAVYKLIKRGTALPAKASKRFRTSRAGQPRLIIEAVKIEGSLRHAESLGHFSLALPPGLPANHPVVVTMSCDANGQIRVDAESTPVMEPQRQ